VPIPDTERKVTDIIDLIVEGSQTIQNLPDEKGIEHPQLVLDPETIYWKTGSVDSNRFAQFVFELKDFEGMADRCYMNMSEERAEGMAAVIREKVRSYRYSIDSKSSETMRDVNNSRQNLLGLISRNKVERTYNLKGGAQRSLADGILGRNVENDADED